MIKTANKPGCKMNNLTLIELMKGGRYMYKFKTIRCRNCGSVVYNLPVNEIKKLKFTNIRCEDCIEHRVCEKSEIKKVV